MDFPYRDVAEEMIDTFGYETAERRFDIWARTVANSNDRSAKETLGEALTAFYRVASKQGHWPTVAS